MIEKQNTQYVLSLSYGKDSMACLGAIKHLGWPLDRIVTADLWATPTIPADPPAMVEFKVCADEMIWRSTASVWSTIPPDAPKESPANA